MLDPGGLRSEGAWFFISYEKPGSQKKWGWVSRVSEASQAAGSEDSASGSSESDSSSSSSDSSSDSVLWHGGMGWDMMGQ